MKKNNEKIEERVTKEKDNKINYKNENYKMIMIIVFTAFITFMLTVLTIFIFYLNGLKVGDIVFVSPKAENKTIASELDLFKEIIDQNYLGEVDEEKLKTWAIKGYIAGLDDPYSEYISKDEMKSYMENIDGNFVGIGIYMSKDNKSDLIKVASVIENSPAQKVGIKEGDLIKKVDGVEYTVKDFNNISQKIKGETGSKVKLEIIRNEQNLEFEIIREKIIVNKVKSDIYDNNVGYIKIPSFDETTSEEFKSNLEDLKSKNIQSLIIDLRDNGGGLVNQALKMLEYITDKDSVLMYEVDKKGREKVTTSANDPIINMPIVVLVNENTASASEIFAGALKDLGKAKIVGKTTYGKGVIQNVLRLKDGAGLKITVEEYKTPNKNQIHKKGIEPDEIVDLPEDYRKEDVQNDTQLNKAIEILK